VQRASSHIPDHDASHPRRVEQIVTALDGRRFNQGADSWVADIVGVHVTGEELWVQVARRDYSGDSIVLHLSRWATAHHAVAALSRLPVAPGIYPHVVEVMQPLPSLGS